MHRSSCHHKHAGTLELLLRTAQKASLAVTMPVGSSTVSFGVGGAFCSPTRFFKLTISAAWRVISVAWRAPVECHS